MVQSRDEQIDAVCHSVRRELLMALLAHRQTEDTEIPLEPFRRRPDGTDRTVSLHHRHLPKLEALGLVVVDSEPDCITRGEEFEKIVPLLNCLRATSDAPTAEGSNAVKQEESRQPTSE